jgi:hypothetical protein
MCTPSTRPSPACEGRVRAPRAATCGAARRGCGLWGAAHAGRARCSALEAACEGESWALMAEVQMRSGVSVYLAAKAACGCMCAAS